MCYARASLDSTCPAIGVQQYLPQTQGQLHNFQLQCKMELWNPGWGEDVSLPSLWANGGLQAVC